MIDPVIKLTVMHDDDSSFTDYSNEMVDYLSRNSTITMSVADYLYIGFHKPFNAVYMAFQTANTNVATMTVEYYDGTTWVSGLTHDDTNGMTRDGLVSWDKTDMESTTVNSIAKYYVRIQLSALSTAMVIRGINMLFSEDRDLQQEYFEITESDFLPSGFTSHLPKHVAARNEIMQELKRRGNQTQNQNTGLLSDINVFDLHDVFQIREAAKHLALSKIFFNLSDNVDDHWFRKFEEYRDKYKIAISLYNFSYDEDGDGVDDLEEKNHKSRSFTWSR